MFGKAYDKAFTPANIKKGFEVTGIYPLNRFVFSDDDFASSAVTDRPAPIETAESIKSPGKTNSSQPFFHCPSFNFELLFQLSLQ